jgi:DNA-directed RNA polymerase II subunit RPB1
VNHAGRTVVSPSLEVDVDEVGIPYSIAKTLTFPEPVNGCNIQELSRMVDRGPDPMDGSPAVLDDTGRRFVLEAGKPPPRLKPGWTVERYMRNGDLALMNRQPSLRKKSLMAHKVVLMPGSTFRFNLSATPAYNMDFDGDEGNLNFLQDYEATAEARELMSVEANIMNAQDSSPCIRIVQDALVGCYKLAQCTLARSRAMQCLSQCRYFEWDMWDRVELTDDGLRVHGRSLVSALLPVAVSFKCVGLRVACGRILPGSQLNKKTMNTLVQYVTLMSSAQAAIRFMSDVQRVVSWWFMDEGFSVGADDCLLVEAGGKVVADLVKRATGFMDGLMQVADPLVPVETRETDILSVMDDTMTTVGGLVKTYMRPTNSIKAMVECGSKGSVVNWTQISGCLGQQTVRGDRIANNQGKSVLSCFHGQPPTASSLGFVSGCYSRGLSPSECFFHAMGGREGIVDTSVRTSETGYLQRRLVKSMESIVVGYDGVLRKAGSNKTVVDFCYGGDGLDGAQLFSVQMWFLEDVEAACRKFADPVERARFLALAEECLVEKITPVTPQLDVRAFLPVDLEAFTFQAESGRPVDSTALDSVLLQLSSEPLNTLFLRTCMCYHLRSDQAVSHPNVLQLVLRRFHAARIQPGEMVGVLSAESLGEPCTQMSLSNFHHAGILNVGMTTGIPRMKELLECSRKLSAPMSVVYVKAPMNSNPVFLRTVAHSLARTTLGDIVLRNELVWEPDIGVASYPDDQFLAETCAAFYGKDAFRDRCNYVMRLTLDRATMLEKDLSPANIRDAIKSQVSGDLLVQASENVMPTWVIRLRPLGVQDLKASLGHPDVVREFERTFCAKVLKTLLEGVNVCGIQGIQKCTVHANPAEAGTYMLRTTGTNLRALWDLPYVAWEQTYSNDPFEVMDLLGVEAAVMVLYQELLMVLSHDGGYVASRHIMMVVNTMTQAGGIMSLTRHGLNKLPTSPLVKCTFEETRDVLYDASAFQLKNPIMSISDSIAVGARVPGGTGIMSVHCTDEYKRRLNQPHAPKLVHQIIRTRISRRAAEAPPTPPTQPQQPPDSMASLLAALEPLVIPEEPGELMWSADWDEPMEEYPDTEPTYEAFSPVYNPESPGMPESPTYDPYSPTPTYNQDSVLVPPASPTYPAFQPRSPQLSATFRPTSPRVPMSRLSTALTANSVGLVDVLKQLASVVKPLYDTSTGELIVDNFLDMLPTLLGSKI